MDLKRVLFCTLLITISQFNSGLGLYEDQAGKFDWHQQYFGNIGVLLNDPNQPKRILIGTTDNIIGAVNANTGAILYRNILESAGRLLYYGISSPKISVAISEIDQVVKVRLFTIATGIQREEFVLTKGVDVRSAIEAGGKFFLVQSPPAGSIGATTIDIYDNEKLLRKREFKSRKDCGNGVLNGRFFTCFEGNSFSALNIIEENSTWAPDMKVTGNIDQIEADNNHNAIIVHHTQGTKHFKSYFVYRAGKLQKVPTEASGIICETNDFNWVVVSSDKIEIFGEDTLRKSSQQDLSLGSHEPSLVRVICQAEKCATILLTTKNVLMGFDSQGRSTWSREESLAHVLDLDMVDYPSELSTINPYFVRRNVFAAFIARIKFEVESLINDKLTSFYSANDRFGLRKVIVFVTKVGRVLGMDTESGSILYAFDLPSYDPALSSNGLLLHLLRPAKYSPLLPISIILYQTPGGKTMSYYFNPIDGVEENRVELPFLLLQAQLLLHSSSEKTQFLKPILALDTDHKLHLIPKHLKIRTQNSYFLVASDQKIQGFYADFEENAGKKIWEHSFPNSIEGIYGKHIYERVHSQGRVLPDRSVSYKYLNPNLVVVVTMSERDSEESTSTTLYLIDAVSGSMIHSFWHKKSRGPVHLVHSENWFVYTLFNEKYRRFEMNSVELYEGQTQSNYTSFSSFSSPPLKPIVVKQSYIFPSGIQAMTDTRTEKGITSKDLLISLPSGGILELPRFLVQPRLSQQHYVHQPDEEFSHLQSIAYIPELPIPSEMIINYNQSVRRVHGIRAWPTKLESTCLILVYGNDLFYTRAMPSKTFDILKDDFDYMFITIVLLGLCAGAYISKRFSAKKTLDQAWR